MKMRVIKKSIKDLTKSYYSPRSKKIINLIKQRLGQKKKTNLTLSRMLNF